jgi:class 3 adenylate cyclase
MLAHGPALDLPQPPSRGWSGRRPETPSRARKLLSIVIADVVGSTALPSR